MIKLFIFIITSIMMVSLLTITINSCKHYDRKFYKTHSGKIVTIWDDYIIFEKYEKNERPKNNYILQKEQYKDGDVRLVVKNNDSIIIFRRCDKNSLDVVFIQPEFKVEIYGNTWDELQTFKKRTSFSDSLVNCEFFYCPYDKIVTISECIGDSVYTRDYGEWPEFYKEYVSYSYDKQYDQ